MDEEGWMKGTKGGIAVFGNGEVALDSAEKEREDSGKVRPGRAQARAATPWSKKERAD
jgi:hypothetical protein